MKRRFTPADSTLPAQTEKRGLEAMKNPILSFVMLLALGTFAQAADPAEAHWQKMFEVMYGLPKSPKDSQLERLRSLIDEGADVNAAIGFDSLLRVGETWADRR